jgi:hypothetical protein
MFDKHVYVRGGGDHTHYHRSEVHEHRAPTDKSVELLKEFEQKAQDKVLGTVRLDGCEVSCVVHHMRDSMNLDHKFLIQYQLGNQRKTVNHTFRPGFHGNHDEMQRLARELCTTLAEDIATSILAPAMDKALPRFRL